MLSLADVRYTATTAAVAAALGLLPACGGDAGTGADAELPPPAFTEQAQALGGAHVAGRDEALLIAARGVMTPLHVSELAHMALVRAFAQRALAHGSTPAAPPGNQAVLAPDTAPLGTGAVVESPVAIDLLAADNADGLMLRGEAGFVRALLRFDRNALGASGQIDGAIVLEVSRTEPGAGTARRSQADALSMTHGGRTVNWSYLDVMVDAQQLVQRLTVVSDIPVQRLGSVWLDVSSSAPERPAAAAAGAPLAAGRYVAAGVIGFLNASLTLQVGDDGAWTIDVDNDKDGQTDFVVRASAEQARTLMLGL